MRTFTPLNPLPPVHPRNRYQGPHDFPALARYVPALAKHFTTTPDGRRSLDFTSPDAVRHLNRALLLRDYGLGHWDLPPGHLVPGVPGRLDYVHVLADLIGPDRPDVIGLDVGTGASLIYPILATHEYGWRMVGTDVYPPSLKIARALVKFNPRLTGKVLLRHQPSATDVFRSVILPHETFAFTMCNPPFFASPEEAGKAAAKKWQKLGADAGARLSFEGKGNELWAPGGEPDFLRRMIRQSADYAEQVEWFTTLVSKKGYLKIADRELDRVKPKERRVINVGQGGKRRRVLAWRW